MLPLMMGFRTRYAVHHAPATVAAILVVLCLFLDEGASGLRVQSQRATKEGPFLVERSMEARATPMLIKDDEHFQATTPR